MMDFEKVEFNKAISLNPSNLMQNEMSNPFVNSKYELVEFGQLTKSLGKGRRPASFADSNGKYPFIKSSRILEKCNEYDFDIEALIIGDGGSANIHYINGKFSSSDHTYIFINNKKNIILKFIYYVINSNLHILEVGFKGIALKNIAKSFIQSLKIPLPPLEIQKQIVAECEKVEEQYNTIRMSVEEYQNLIKAILQKCGIIDDGGGYELNSILENLQKLESKLDFNLLFSFIDDFTNARQEDLKKFKEFVKNIKAILDTLLISPKDGWKRISLKNEQYIELNPSKKEISKLDENMLVSFIEMASVSDKGYIQSKIDRSLNEVRKGYTYFIENDILIAKITPCMENGKCAIAKNLTNNIGFGSTEFHIFRAKTGLDSSFLFYNLNQQNIREKAALAMTGASGHKRVPISFYENLTIPLPPLEIQEKIVQNIELVEQQIDFLNLKLEFLEKEKEKILQKYLFS